MKLGVKVDASRPIRALEGMLRALQSGALVGELGDAMALIVRAHTPLGRWGGAGRLKAAWGKSGKVIRHGNTWTVGVGDIDRLGWPLKPAPRGVLKEFIEQVVLPNKELRKILYAARFAEKRRDGWTPDHTRRREAGVERRRVKHEAAIAHGAETSTRILKQREEAWARPARRVAERRARILARTKTKATRRSRAAEEVLARMRQKVETFVEKVRPSQPLRRPGFVHIWERYMGVGSGRLRRGQAVDFSEIMERSPQKEIVRAPKIEAGFHETYERMRQLARAERQSLWDSLSDTQRETTTEGGILNLLRWQDQIIDRVRAKLTIVEGKVYKSAEPLRATRHQWRKRRVVWKAFDEQGNVISGKVARGQNVTFKQTPWTYAGTEYHRLSSNLFAARRELNEFLRDEAEALGGRTINVRQKEYLERRKKGFVRTEEGEDDALANAQDRITSQMSDHDQVLAQVEAQEPPPSIELPLEEKIWRARETFQATPKTEPRRRLEAEVNVMGLEYEGVQEMLRMRRLEAEGARDVMDRARLLPKGALNTVSLRAMEDEAEAAQEEVAKWEQQAGMFSKRLEMLRERLRGWNEKE